MRMIRVIGLTLFIALLLSGCTEFSSKPDRSPTANDSQGNDSADGNTNQDNPPDSNNEASNETSNPDAPPDEITDAVWMAAGDVMMHMPQLPGAYDSKTKKYNFNPFFEQVQPILKQADWSLVNLETPIGGKALGYSGFPRFNAPSELADALKYAGFTVVTNANNHALDRGAKGVELTLEKLQKLGFAVKGTARSQSEADAITIVERKGIRMGLLAYTYGTNGIPLPANKPYTVSLIDESAIIRDIKRLRAAGVDFITVSLHFGTEYQTVPNNTQTALARKLIAAGADIIAGSHPHVVQPYETVEAVREDGTIRRGLIIYSMGNFISNQRGDTKDYGVIFKVHIQKNVSKGITTIGDVEPIPTWVKRTKQSGVNHYVIIPVEQTLLHHNQEGLTNADYEALKTNLDILAKRFASMSQQPYTLKDSIQ
ncbi:CapA family protein [Paenibacillus solisilvae]|uniref:CapA family protein n=1 Tax=Paenibacillus solisilvae TaxID=2486751 RepID=A0ABW0VTY7_9BACL